MKHPKPEEIQVGDRFEGKFTGRKGAVTIIDHGDDTLIIQWDDGLRSVWISFATIIDPTFFRYLDRAEKEPEK